MGKTLFQKIWNKHIVKQVTKETAILYIDLQLLHEVTSAPAFSVLEMRGLGVLRPERNKATTDHNVPTINQSHPIHDLLSRQQVRLLGENCQKHNIELFGLGHPNQGIVHVIGPELGLSQPGMTIVCGDSHTSTHGALGCIAFGIGSTEVALVLATQCLPQQKPRMMRVHVSGTLQQGVTAKDLALFIIGIVGVDGATGSVIEFTGDTISNLSIEGRMTLCNMSIEMGAKSGIIAPDDKTVSYLKGRMYIQDDLRWEDRVKEWMELYSDEDAHFDILHSIDASTVASMITYGTNPGMSIPIGGCVPKSLLLAEDLFRRSLEYMGFSAGETLIGKKIDYVFIGSCTNSRIEDLREVAKVVKGRKRSPDVTVWIVPGSKSVEKQAQEEGLDVIFRDADMSLRQPGCSACLAMNGDIVPEGKYCVSTSNRNFEGRQGNSARTLLVSPIAAAVAAITGEITDVMEFLKTESVTS